MKKLSWVLVLAMVLAFAFGFAGCTNEPAADPEPVNIADLEGPDLHFTPENWPKIDGATALAPYYEAMAAELLGMDIDEAKQYVLCNKTDGAYENLLAGNVDMIFCSLPSDYFEQVAADQGFEYDMTPFLNGAFVFFVNKDNPVDSITLKQAHDIYAGKITNWSELGGKDEPIVAFQRPDNSGSQTGLYEYVISADELMEAPSEQIFGAMDEIVDAVSSYDNGKGSIGYSYYYYVVNMHYQEDIKLLAINDIMPSDETIANGTYPIINPSYVIIDAKTPADSPLRDIIKWITSEKGQYIGRQQGYVPREDCE